MVLVVDDEDRENEGDLTLAAEWVTPEAINFMLRWARGLVCMPCDAARLDELEIGPMVAAGRRGLRHRVHGVDRPPRTRAAASAPPTVRSRSAGFSTPSPRPETSCGPGHVFPLRARPGGVLERRGHTEAAVDLARLAGLAPAAVICEVLHDDGSPGAPALPRDVRAGAPGRDDLRRPARRASPRRPRGERVGTSGRPLLL